MSYSQPDNDAVDFSLEDYDQPDNDQVDFSLNEEAVATEEPGFDVDTDPIDLPLSIDLPVQPINLQAMNVGVSVFLVGLLATLGGAVAFLKNYAAGIVLCLAVFGLISSGLFGIGLELFWAMIGATILLLVAGMIARWMT